MTAEDRPLLSARGLVKTFRRAGQRPLVALAGVDLELWPARAHGLVGESGCGKTTLGRCLLRLLRPDEGRVTFDGIALERLGGRRLRALRQQLQLVFQASGAALDPRLTAAEAIAEPLRSFAIVPRGAREAEVERLLRIVGLPTECAALLPRQLSGGQRQRICIARALAPRPRLLVADEPTSALDLSVQAQIINLLGRLRRERGLAMLLITHDLRLVLQLCDVVSVMYRGRVVERLPADELRCARHPYTRALWRAVPRPGARAGDVEAGADVASASGGCPYQPRCARHRRIGGRRCREQLPQLVEIDREHAVRCHEPEQHRKTPECLSPADLAE